MRLARRQDDRRAKNANKMAIFCLEAGGKMKKGRSIIRHAATALHDGWALRKTISPPRAYFPRAKIKREEQMSGHAMNCRSIVLSPVQLQRALVIMDEIVRLDAAPPAADLSIFNISHGAIFPVILISAPRALTPSRQSRLACNLFAAHTLTGCLIVSLE